MNIDMNAISSILNVLKANNGANSPSKTPPPEEPAQPTTNANGEPLFQPMDISEFFNPQAGNAHLPPEMIQQQEEQYQAEIRRRQEEQERILAQKPIENDQPIEAGNSWAVLGEAEEEDMQEMNFGTDHMTLANEPELDMIHRAQMASHAHTHAGHAAYLGGPPIPVVNLPPGQATTIPGQLPHPNLLPVVGLPPPEALPQLNGPPTSTTLTTPLTAHALAQQAARISPTNQPQSHPPRAGAMGLPPPNPALFSQKPKFKDYKQNKSGLLDSPPVTQNYNHDPYRRQQPGQQKFFPNKKFIPQPYRPEGQNSRFDDHRGGSTSPENTRRMPMPTAFLTPTPLETTPLSATPTTVTATTPTPGPISRPTVQGWRLLAILKTGRVKLPLLNLSGMSLMSILGVRRISRRVLAYLG